MVSPKEIGEVGRRTIAQGQRTPGIGDGNRASLRCQKKESGDKSPHSKGAMAEW